MVYTVLLTMAMAQQGDREIRLGKPLTVRCVNNGQLGSAIVNVSYAKEGDVQGCRQLLTSIPGQGGGWIHTNCSYATCSPSRGSCSVSRFPGQLFVTVRPQNCGKDQCECGQPDLVPIKLQMSATCDAVIPCKTTGCPLVYEQKESSVPSFHVNVKADRHAPFAAPRFTNYDDGNRLVAQDADFTWSSTAMELALERQNTSTPDGEHAWYGLYHSHNPAVVNSTFFSTARRRSYIEVFWENPESDAPASGFTSCNLTITATSPNLDDVDLDVWSEPE